MNGFSARIDRIKDRLSNKVYRSNRGRGRHAAVVWNQEHHRYPDTQIRGHFADKFKRKQKRAERHAWREEVAGQLFDMELAACDNDCWSFGENLVTYADLRPKMSKTMHDTYFHCGNASAMCMSMYSAPNLGNLRFDRDYEEQYYQDMMEMDYHRMLDDMDRLDDMDNYGYTYATSSYNDCMYDTWDNENAEVDCKDPAWVNLWVDGKVEDPDLANDEYHRGIYRDVYDELFDYDEFEEYFEENPLQVTEREVLITDNSDPAFDKMLEKYRAGEVYYNQNKRTVNKPIWSGTPFEKCMYCHHTWSEHPVKCHGCQTCQFRCDHTICHECVIKKVA